MKYTEKFIQETIQSLLEINGIPRERVKAHRREFPEGVRILSLKETNPDYFINVGRLTKKLIKFVEKL